MFGTSVVIPEPFCSALERDAAQEVCDCEAPTAQALFGRGLARTAVGREADARGDFEAGRPELGDACSIELAFLDIRQRGAIANALETARRVATGAAADPLLAARAWHIVGLAEGKLRNTREAVKALLRAAELYRSCNERRCLAQVRDTLGMVQAASGRLDDALQHYALSLVDKALLGDRMGMAITLGNLGRLYLRTGRYDDALDCFNRDLDLAIELGDLRGQARMRNDLGRTLLGRGDPVPGDVAQAERHLLECLDMARSRRFHDIEFFARKDLVSLRIAQGRPEEAATELAAAEAALPPGAEPYFAVVLLAAGGELFLAQGAREAVEALRKAVEGFAQGDLPDLEIPTRISLARALLKQNERAQAERCLLPALRLARADGYARYLAALNEAMAELSLVEGITDESGRELGKGVGLPDTTFIELERLGQGGFGEVFRAYDPQRGREVALKRLNLDRLYDVAQRRRLLDSARTELEAASRIRHPGVVRVLAMGTEPDGGTYILQEFVHGGSLRKRMSKDNRASLVLVADCLARVAEALKALHDAGVVHRDLKPENIIVRDDGSPVLVDFGIAQLADAVPSDDEAKIVGTLTYMAPEQAQCRPSLIGPKTDLYSLGVIAYEWLSGLLPLRLANQDDQSRIRLLMEIAETMPAPLSEHRSGLDSQLENLVMKLLAKKPRQRPANAAAVAEQLRKLAAGWRRTGETETE